MDIFELVSSEQENYHESDGARESPSTDLERPSNLTSKTKTIRKKYQPIQEGGKIIKYEDNPQEYRRARKKIQNRQSATRVRGRKKNAFETLQQEVEHLRSVNSELLLINAKLQTENKTLKDQITFLKDIIKPNYKNDPIDKYLELTQQSTPIHHSNDEFFVDESEDWVRLPSVGSVGKGSWLNLTIFTIIIAVFVIPSQNTAISVGFESKQFQVGWQSQVLSGLKVFSKLLIVMIYLIYSLSFLYKSYLEKKLKRV